MYTLDLVIVEFVVVAVVCVLLLRYYKANMVTLDVAAMVFLSWILGFAGILLLPFDISVAVVDGNLAQERHMLDTVWNFIYWSTFCLAWVILPLQMEYHNSGQFTVVEKLQDAVIKNMSFYIFAGLAGLVYVVYMVSTNEASLSQVISFLMAMGNTYGVLLITVLMGSGLVGLPRRLWQTGDVETELRRLYMQAPGIESAYQEARFELEDSELVVDKAIDLLAQSPLESPFVRNLGLYVSVLETSVANFEFAGRAMTRKYVASANAGAATQPLDTKKGLVELHARLKQAQMRARAGERRWMFLVQQCKRAEKILAGEHPHPEAEEGSAAWCAMQTEVSTADPAARPGAAGALHTLSQRCWKKTTTATGRVVSKCEGLAASSTAKTVGRTVAVVCSLVSVVILWSELVMASQMKSPVGLVMGAYSQKGDQNAVVMQGVAFLALSYMSICTYWSLFQLNLGWSYRLQGPQQSLPASLIFNGEYFSRLQFALGYNFLLFLNVPATDATSFNRLMSNITIVPVFGTSFTVYVPIVMIAVALMTLFNVLARLLRLIGLDAEDAGTPSCYETLCGCFRSSRTVVLGEDDLERYESGKKLVANYIRMRSAAAAGGGGAGNGSSSASASRKSKITTASSSSATKQRGGAADDDDDPEEIDISTGSGARRNLLPMGVGGRYSNLGIVPPRKTAVDAGGSVKRDTSRDAADHGTDGNSNKGGGGAAASGGGTLPPWAAQAGALWSGVVTKAAQGTAALAPLADRYSAFVTSLRGGAPLSRQEDADTAEVEFNHHHTRPAAAVAKVAPQAAPTTAAGRGYSFGLDDSSTGSSSSNSISKGPTSNVYVGRYSNV